MTPIENVVYERNFDSHSNETRTIVSVLKIASESQVPINQVRVAQVKKDSPMGNHWREYGEIYGIIGSAEFLLEEIDTKIRKKYFMKTGDTLYIPPRIAINVKAVPNAVIICCSENYDGEKGTHKYELV